jgi:hypothetical protein
MLSAKQRLNAAGTANYNFPDFLTKRLVDLFIIHLHVNLPFATQAPQTAVGRLPMFQWTPNFFPCAKVLVCSNVFVCAKVLGCTNVFVCAKVLGCTNVFVSAKVFGCANVLVYFFWC